MNEILFVYNMFGRRLTWKVLKPFGRGYLCEIKSDDPKLQGTRAEFDSSVIKLGIEMLRLEKKIAGVPLVLVH